MTEFNLSRFVAAQAETYATALHELRRGRKAGHWMWFIFPQLSGLGQSHIALKYGIQSRGEAAEYLAHPLLGTRLKECTTAVLCHRLHGPEAVFGVVDAKKFRSSMTLFEAVAGVSQVFSNAIDIYFQGQRDDLTLLLLESR